MADNVDLKTFYQNIMQKTSLMFGHQFLVNLKDGNDGSFARVSSELDRK